MADGTQGTDREQLAEREQARKRLHDMRNALSPALLLAERLEQHEDPMVALTGSRIIAAIEDAVRAGRDGGRSDGLADVD